MTVYYQKDSYWSEGSDACWVDNIRYEFDCEASDNCTKDLDCGD